MVVALFNLPNLGALTYFATVIKHLRPQVTPAAFFFLRRSHYEKSMLF